MQEEHASIKSTLQDKLVLPVKAQFEAIREENRQITQNIRKLMIWLVLLSVFSLINLSIIIYILVKN